MLDLIVLHGEFSLFTVRGNFWYQIYQNQRQKILCQLMALITSLHRLISFLCVNTGFLEIIIKLSYLNP